MKVLVAVASKHGATDEIAREIGAVLSQRGLSTTVLPVEDVDSVEQFGAVVLGSAVYMGQWLKPARTLAETHAGALRARPVWLFSSGPIGAPLFPKDETLQVQEILEAVGARDHRVFPGKLDRKSLNLVQKLVAAVIRGPVGDFRDWDAVRDWAGGIADQLAAIDSGQEAE